MKVNTLQLEEKLVKILQVQQRPDVTITLFKELGEKALKYKEIIDFLQDEDIDSYLRTEEKELDEQSLKKHMGEQ